MSLILKIYKATLLIAGIVSIIYGPIYIKITKKSISNWIIGILLLLVGLYSLFGSLIWL